MKNLWKEGRFMKFEGLIMSGICHKKMEKTSFTKKDGSIGYFYPVILDLDLSCPTVNVSEEIYRRLVVGEKYIFYCSVDTENQYVSRRFVINDIRNFEEAVKEDIKQCDSLDNASFSHQENDALEMEIIDEDFM